jgi:putative cardiolipin synthase
MAPDLTTDLDRLLAPHEASHPAKSAFRLVHDGHEAFGLRVRSAELAQRTLDVQTYIWRADVTGRYLAARLLAAADRGVRVRLLLDDMDARAKNAGFAAFQGHPQVEIRLFNPFASRDGTLAFLREAVGSFARINRRMHNKTWIADNRIAIAGGRNLGDEYFGASERVNFVDLDFLAFGPIVRDMSASFDVYWNSSLAYPIDTLDPAAVGNDQLAALRETLTAAEVAAQSSEYAATLRDSETLQRIVEGRMSVEWTAAYRFVVDDPMKAATQPDPSLSQIK